MRKLLFAVSLGLVAATVTSGTALAIDRAGVNAVRDKAAAVLKEKGIEEGAKFLGDPANGLVDLQGSGMHTWAITRKGVIVFDHSGQTQPGMDVADLTVVDGESVTGKTFRYADQPGGGAYDEPNTWPHPVTGAISNSYLSCVTIANAKDVAVCAMAWIK